MFRRNDGSLEKKWEGFKNNCEECGKRLIFGVGQMHHCGTCRRLLCFSCLQRRKVLTTGDWVCTRCSDDPGWCHRAPSSVPLPHSAMMPQPPLEHAPVPLRSPELSPGRATPKRRNSGDLAEFLGGDFSHEIGYEEFQAALKERSTSPSQAVPPPVPVNLPRESHTVRNCEDCGMYKVPVYQRGTDGRLLCSYCRKSET